MCPFSALHGNVPGEELTAVHRAADFRRCTDRNLVYVFSRRPSSGFQVSHPRYTYVHKLSHPREEEVRKVVKTSSLEVNILYESFTKKDVPYSTPSDIPQPVRLCLNDGCSFCVCLFSAQLRQRSSNVGCFELHRAGDLARYLAGDYLPGESTCG